MSHIDGAVVDEDAFVECTRLPRVLLVLLLAAMMLVLFTVLLLVLQAPLQALSHQLEPASRQLLSHIPRPDHTEHARLARWLVHLNTWGTLSTQGGCRWSHEALMWH